MITITNKQTEGQIGRQTGNEEGESLNPSDPSLVRLNGTNFYKTNFSLENNQPKQPNQKETQRKKCQMKRNRRLKELEKGKKRRIFIDIKA